MDLGTLTVRINADNSALVSGIRQAQSRIAGMQSKMASVGAGMKSLGTQMSLGVTAPLLLMGKIGTDELRSIEKANAQTASALAQIGSKSLVSVGGVQALAEALQKKSGIDDQAVQSGSNMILQLGALDTKTRAGAKAFDLATKAMVGFSDFTGTDAVSAGKLFGKTLAAASQGTILLPRGVKLSGAAMKDLQAKFKAATTGAEKQKVVAEALSKRFSSLAKLTPTEKIDLFKDKLAGLAAGIMSRLMPALDPIGRVLERLAGWFDKLSPSTQKWIAIIGMAAAVIGPLLVVVGALVTAVAAISLPVLGVAAAIGVLAAAFVVAWRRSDSFREFVTKNFQKLRAGVMQVLASLKATIAQWVAWGSAIWKAHGAQIKAVIIPLWNGLRQFIAGAMNAIKNTILMVLAALRGDWRAAWTALKGVVAGAMQAAAGAVRSGVALIRGALKLLWAAIRSAASAAFSAAVEIGRAIIDGIVSGIKSGAGAIASAARDAASSAVKAAKDALSIRSPSRVMAVQVGAPIADGVAMGIRSRQGATDSAMRGMATSMRDTGRDVAASPAGGGGIHIGQMTIVASNDRGGREAGRAFLEAIGKTDARQRAYNPRIRVAH